MNVNGEHEIVQLIDWVSDATYNVYPLGINDPHSGSRVKVVDPAHPKASPLGWHAHSSSVSFTTTIGNNVYAQENLGICLTLFVSKQDLQIMLIRGIDRWWR